MKKIFILAIVSFLIIFGLGTVLRLKYKNSNESLGDNQENSLFVFDEQEFDFEVIDQSGGKVSHDFKFVYKGEDPITIVGVPTSCACTSAVVNKTTFNSGDSGIITVKFNPNLHLEPEGKFFKTASIITEPKLNEIPEVKIWVEINLDLGSDAYELQSNHNEENEEGSEVSYKLITPEKLQEMMKNKDFTLIDVHIPTQEHIVGTDGAIPYNDIADSKKLPKDKNAKIVLYCRSGGMSRVAVDTLIEEGYTNVYDLSGGKYAYDKFLESSLK
ncbi:MAG: hypothetical protein CO137_01835 [Candidatus Magasanikbacteria bacterium CG_4_9_14_3_um_filter_32_9]|uniref:Rhodanese domain-containing protein n=1 Tax=Candidatus Magasanikbacteria bacterium CG_4_9_14_3_um_filter_32_9 TaxID=1974644 RepID=A0A2M7Z723_9BACT|nr:MAG: hypothetical protein CO137_01835 [Candidatus Magasanikbacteria bacterium CG_4_9_14_3_um_filter_32_9]